MQAWWYTLDAEDRVVGVSPGWDEFALDNDAPGATADNVVGRSFFDQVSGAETRQLLRTIFDRVRKANGPVELPFRCDAPRLRRFMTCSPERTEDGGLRVHTRLLAEGARTYFPVLEEADDGGRQPIRMCAWCQRIAVGPATWVEPETAAERLGLLATEVPAITHGICAQCEAGVEHRFALEDVA